MDCSLKYVDAIRDRYGKWRYYFRRHRLGKRIRIKGEPGSPEFLAAYNAFLLAPKADRSSGFPPPKVGSFEALRQLYYASAEFTNLAQSTQRETRYVIDAICAHTYKDGSKRASDPINRLERRHILAWRDHLAKKPGAANKMLRTLSAWLSFAVSRQLIEKNPAFGIKPLKTGRYRAWTDEELAAFEARWPIGTRERAGYALALYTVQRASDVVLMKWAMIAGGAMILRQKKTGTDLEIPLHPALKEALVGAGRSGETILTGKNGRAISAVYFGDVMARAIEEAGLSSECVLHGLRKTGARLIAETGGRVRAMTGHLSAQMERAYERDAEQKKMARAAVLKWARKTHRNKK